ncbi:MAG: 4Fe-4S dicluster domain-containing protein [Candidatus Lokiarchaeota archaeon]|nr:4Fe-4S dicluster domain-containing protein [Candidatus Lokiarchaeota archaeon]MBD3199175.1 4Fe-4S dicluster domain-containing protein [Candidatus Lokiarchaeota archaeon]
MYTQEDMKEILKDNVVNLRFHARGGQGGVTASNLCVEAFYGYGICQPKFGAERMGSPTESYVRLSANIDLIRSNEQVYAPQFVSVLDPSLLSEVEVTAGVPEGGWLIVNTTLDQVQIQDIVGRKDINIATIDATRIALEVLGRNITNTIILGALVRVSHLFSFEALSDAVMRRFKDSIAAKNIEAIEQAIEETCVYDIGKELDFSVDTKVAWQQVDLGLPGYKEVDKAGVWYCDEDVIKVGSDQVNTGSWGEWNIIWDEETCTDCAQCWFICPDFAILREKGEDGKYHMAGIDREHCKSCQNCLEVCPVNAISKQLKQGPASCAVPEEAEGKT